MRAGLAAGSGCDASYRQCADLQPRMTNGNISVEMSQDRFEPCKLEVPRLIDPRLFRLSYRRPHWLWMTLHAA